MIYLYVRALSPTENPSARAAVESRFAREVLLSAIREELSLKPSEIIQTERGKPYFENKEYPRFSISHTEGAVAVAFSTDADEIGVDIEEDSERLKNKRLCERFFPGLSLCENEIEDCEISLSLPEDSLLSPSGADALYTLGEAVIKCAGEGFSAAASAAALGVSMKKSSYAVTIYDKRYYISLAVLEDKNERI